MTEVTKNDVNPLEGERIDELGSGRRVYSNSARTLARREEPSTPNPRKNDQHSPRLGL